MAITDFKEMLRQVVVIAPLVSRDSYGAPVYGPEASTKARIGHSKTIMRGSDGSDIAVSSQVWMLKKFAVSAQDKIIMPDGSTPPILKVEEYWDDDITAHHLKLLLG